MPKRWKTQTETPEVVPSFADAMRERMMRSRPDDHPVYCYYTPTEPPEEQRSVRSADEQ